ncbi:MAG: phosphatase PAP2 family protein [Candidatus Nomurabacteria bacterium]|nr:phosphatase PAP2 family protein [Candidatus Nomurabacteria bacterium]
MNIIIFLQIYSLAHQSVWLDNVIWFFAVPTIYIMIIVAAIFIFIHYKFYKIKDIFIILRDKWKEIFLIIFSPAIAWVIASLLKVLIHTNRPFIILSNIHTLFAESGYAFPSGHATAISALAFAIYFKNKRLGYVFMIAGLLIGLARVAGGVHFPIDIIGGYIVGFLVAFLVKKL